MSGDHQDWVAQLERDDDGRTRLVSPTVGVWRGGPAVGRLIEPGTRIGEIQTLGRWRPIVAPAGAWGRVESLDPGQERLSGGLGYGATLLRLNPDGVEAADSSADAEAAATLSDLVFRAPTSGRFYARPSPEEEPFVKVGDTLSEGATICLLEVMKTFNRVTYGGEGLPAQVKVVAVHPADGDDVDGGQVLLGLEALTES